MGTGRCGTVGVVGSGPSPPAAGAASAARCPAVKYPSLRRLLFFPPLSARFSGSPRAERWYLMFSDPCSFCCRCCCPPSRRELPNRHPGEHAPPAGGSRVRVCVCVYIYVHVYTYTYIHIHISASPCLCVCSPAPPRCPSGTALCPRASPAHSVSPCSVAPCELRTTHTCGPPRPCCHVLCQIPLFWELGRRRSPGGWADPGRASTATIGRKEVRGGHQISMKVPVWAHLHLAVKCRSFLSANTADNLSQTILAPCETQPWWTRAVPCRAAGAARCRDPTPSQERGCVFVSRSQRLGSFKECSPLTVAATFPWTLRTTLSLGGPPPCLVSLWIPR